MIRLIGVFLFLVVYFIISLPIQLAELIIQKFNMDIRNKSSLSFVQWGLKCVMFISGVKLEVTGYENIPKDTPVLFVGNHNSFYDIIVTYPLMERPTGFVAKKEIKKVPFLSWWMYFVNCIFLDRSDPRAGLKSVLDAAGLIKKGISVFLFPEGTRSKDGNMLEFKDGKHTGRTIDADIIYMLEDYTGLTEGYCILGIRVTDYTGKVSETDTESGAVNV